MHHAGDGRKSRRVKRRAGGPDAGHCRERAPGHEGRSPAGWSAGPARSRVGKEKYAGSWAEYLGHQLGAVDFLNQATLLAATLLLCAVPFLLIASALAGRSAVTALTVRLGLSQQAAADVGHLFTSSAATDAAGPRRQGL